MKCKCLIFKLLIPIVYVFFFMIVENTYAANTCDGFFKGSKATAMKFNAVNLFKVAIQIEEARIQENTQRFASRFMPEYLKVTENIQVKYKELKAVIEEYLTKLELESLSDRAKASQSYKFLILTKFDPNKDFNNKTGKVFNLYSRSLADKLLSISKEIAPEVLFRVLYEQGRSDIEGSLLLYLNNTQEKQVLQRNYKELVSIHSQLLERKLIIEKDKAAYAELLRKRSRGRDENEYIELSKSMSRILYEEGFDKKLIGAIDKVRQEYRNKQEIDYRALFGKLNKIISTLKSDHPLLRLRDDSVRSMVDLLASVSNVSTEIILADLIYEVSFDLSRGDQFFDIYPKHKSLRKKLDYEY